MRQQSKVQYEAEISDLFSRYAEASGCGTEVLRKTLLYRLINAGAEYIFKYVPIPNKEEYGEEIFTTIHNCILSFNADKGANFVHYLRASIKNNLARSVAQNHDFEKYQGLGISTKTIIKIRKVLYQKQLFMESKKNAGFEEMVQWIAKNLGLTPQGVKKYLDKSNLLATGNPSPNNQDDFYEYPDLNSLSPEKIVFRMEFLQETLDAFTEVFGKTQNRIKPYLSRLISAKYYAYFEAVAAPQQLQEKYPFFDYEAITAWHTGKETPAQKDIAREWGRTEQDASRTIGRFEKKIQKKLRKW
jgi:DNA-directed RNA polymerase specialized sigma subunit